MTIVKERNKELEVYMKEVRDEMKDLKQEIKTDLFEINRNLVLLSTCMMGVPNTDDKGLYGKVSIHESKIYCLESKINRQDKILWALIAVLIATNVIQPFVLSALLGS